MRPTKYKKAFHNKDFIRLSKMGKTVTQIALIWDVNRSSIYEWANHHEEFSTTIKKGKLFSEAWYMELGQQAMIGAAKIDGQKIKVDVGLFVWLTKNMFKWTDKVEVKPDDNILKARPLAHLSDKELDELEEKIESEK